MVTWYKARNSDESRKAHQRIREQNRVKPPSDEQMAARAKTEMLNRARKREYREKILRGEKPGSPPKIVQQKSRRKITLPVISLREIKDED